MFYSERLEILYFKYSYLDMEQLNEIQQKVQAKNTKEVTDWGVMVRDKTGISKNIKQ